MTWCSPPSPAAARRSPACRPTASALRTSAACTSSCSPPALPIGDVNAVRKHVSALKGGRLAARIAPATVVNLTASDVAGDVLDVITDPTVQDGSTVADAVAVLREHGLWD